MTETSLHPVDLALRAVTTTFEPSRADFDSARVMLMEAISSTLPPSRSRIRLLWAAVIALSMVIAFFLVQTTSTSPAEALVTELARVVETTDPLVIPDDLFAYTLTEETALGEVEREALDGVEIPHDSLAYGLPQTRETWIGDEGTARLSTTYFRPVFFSSADEAAYYAAGLDQQDKIGETVIETQPDASGILDEMDWPTDPAQLEATIRSLVGDTDLVVLETCLKLLRATLIPPQLRTGVLLVVAGLDPELVDESPDGAGTFSVSFESPEPKRWTFTLDATGHLRFEELILVDGDPARGVPPGTAEYTATYTVPRLVDGADLP
ncbi:MAG TPA: hypothetical protein VJA46_14425 [Acidimicrobiia bacterium]|nr:hypothetical protein [Acidimicrobiia bacterium]